MTLSQRELRLAAPAKLNLSLRVTGRRPDGFHELASLFVLLELADELRLLPGGSGLLVDADSGIALPDAASDNLAWRGLAAGLETEPAGACLALDKRIPSAAGLGGGSSDAAAAWRLGRRWHRANEQPQPADLESLSAIGADVPFFAAQCAAAWVTGIGERVERFAMPADTPREAILVHAPFQLATAEVFAELHADEWGTGAATPDQALGPGDTGNDLLAPASRLRPELEDLRRLVISAGVEPRLTGSGPTLFALLDDPERADAVASRLRRASLRVTRTRLRSEPARIEPVGAAEEGQG